VLGDWLTLAPEARAMPFFVMTNERAIIAVNKPLFHIGRRARVCDYVLDHPAISRLHLTVRVDGAKTFVTDNKTRNGTLVNGVPLTGERELVEGDVIEICGIALEFRADMPVDQLAR
jgi:pSer/pThr/pTyr-binding forkhead associated (FHA) protein